MKILSVDDKVENLYLLETMLKGADCGYQVESAHNGVEALDALGRDKFDLIISDILMPQMDGFELCHRVKQRDDLRHIPFVFYTATYTEKKDEELGFRLGASRFIIKPQEPERFLAMLGQLLEEYKTGRLVSAPPPTENEEVLLKEYNRRLVRKLDRKVQQLDQTTHQLQAALGDKERELVARRNAEQQIRLQAAALQSAANGILITDRQGIIQWVNSAFEHLTGYSEAEANGQTPRLLKSGQQSPGFFKAMWETIMNGQVWHGELVNKRKDGSFYNEEMTVTPVRDGAGEITHFIAIKQDISERKRAEAALRLARDDLMKANADLERKVENRTAQLVEANANLQTFTHNAAHDLRSPLRAIQTFSAMALQDCGEKLGPEGGSLLERVVSSAGQMQRLLNDLLEYSKMSQADLKLEPMSLGNAVNEALALLDHDIRGKRAVITVIEPLPDVIGHLATVVVLITNFISNALKFMPTGLQPRIRIWAESRHPERGITAPSASKTAEPHTSPSTLRAHVVRLWVEDNGIGIAREHLQKIFYPFERLHSKQNYPGTGLGLAIARKGAERIGGRIGVEAEPGKGSRFWVELASAES
jgi:PAS domain S-box-containing protein